MKPNKPSKMGFLKFAAFVVAMLVLASCQAGNATETQNPTIEPTPSQTAEPTVTPTDVPPTPTEDLEQVITDLAARREQVKADILSKAGVSSWDEYTDKLALQDINLASGSEYDPISHGYVEGKIEEKDWVEVKNQSLVAKELKRAKIWWVTFDNTNDPAPVLLGFDTDDGFVPTVGFDIDAGGYMNDASYHRFTTEEQFDALVGRKRVFEVALRFKGASKANTEDKLSNWNTLLPGSVDHKRFFTFLDDNQKDMFAEVVMAPGIYVWDNTYNELVRNPIPEMESCRGARCATPRLVYFINSGGDGWLVVMSVGDDILSMVGRYLE